MTATDAESVEVREDADAERIPVSDYVARVRVPLAWRGQRGSMGDESG